MKASFHSRPLNGPFDDPGIYVRVLREGRAMIFDPGFTTSLSPRDILKTSDIFISHTHIDHFIGFDNILRVCLKKKTPLRLYGPAGFTECIEGKLRGYTWNLIGEYPLVMEVTEVAGSSVKKSVFKAEDSFMRKDMGTFPFHGVLMKDSFYTVSAVELDHRIPCLAFSLEEDYHINIDKSMLQALGLPVGPWLGQLKTAVRENQGRTFLINDREYSFSKLKSLVSITRGQKLSYVVDALGSEENIRKIMELAKGSDVLYIETYFLDEERERAGKRHHLTAGEAGRIARDADVRRMVAIHFSPRHLNDPEKLIQEARHEFEKR